MQSVGAGSCKNAVRDGGQSADIVASPYACSSTMQRDRTVYCNFLLGYQTKCNVLEINC